MGIVNIGSFEGYNFVYDTSTGFCEMKGGVDYPFLIRNSTVSFGKLMMLYNFENTYNHLIKHFGTYVLSIRSADGRSKTAVIFLNFHIAQRSCVFDGAQYCINDILYFIDVRCVTCCIDSSCWWLKSIVIDGFCPCTGIAVPYEFMINLLNLRNADADCNFILSLFDGLLSDKLIFMEKPVFGKKRLYHFDYRQPVIGWCD